MPPLGYRHTWSCVCPLMATSSTPGENGVVLTYPFKVAVPFEELTE